MKKIQLSGKIILQLLKDDNGSAHAIILQDGKNGVTPLYDFTVEIIQENPSMGIEISFNAEDIHATEASLAGPQVDLAN